MKHLSPLSLLISLFLALPACAQSYPAKAPASTTPPTGPATVCPWLTEGSAAAALGGSVRVTLNVASGTQGACTFTRKDAPQSQLKIVIGPANVPACPASSPPVVGIGTQATRCHLSPSQVQTEMISGKVRALSMAVTLSGVSSPSLAGLDYRPAVDIEQIAEQVAGNLF